MEFTKSLVKGKLIKRYKRFFTDVKLGKEIVTAHCPNTCLLYTSPSPRDLSTSRMPSSA